jgi:hypothetical protein
MQRIVLALLGVVLLPVVVFAQSGQTVEYYHTDAVGSVRAVTQVVNGQVQIVSRHDFMPFGEEVNPPNPPTDKRLFTGQERDFEKIARARSAQHWIPYSILVSILV